MINPTKDQWDRRVIEFGGSILQSWKWGEFQESLGFKIHRLSSDGFVTLVIETPLAAGKKYLYAPRGPLGDVEEANRAIKKIADKDHTIVFTRIEPATSVNLPRAVKETQPTNNWMLDLVPTEEQILIGMKPKTRYGINLAQRKGVKVREGGKADLIDVYKLLLETAGRKTFRLHPQNYYWQAFELLAPDNLRILVAEYQGKPLACMLLTLYGKTATYMHGGSSSAMKDVQASYLLHWEAMKLAKSLGMETYDLGGIAPQGQVHHAWAGITRFKRSFGGFEVVYAGAFEIIYSPLWYNVYKNARTLRNLIKK
jgi:lipid II:glycine glycyltransferase (peptidoglycan interpeptide bridge formation enzyme)